jgi:hypothetical protein
MKYENNHKQQKWMLHNNCLKKKISCKCKELGYFTSSLPYSPYFTLKNSFSFKYDTRIVVLHPRTKIYILLLPSKLQKCTKCSATKSQGYPSIAHLCCISFEIFTPVTVKILVLSFVTPYNFVSRYHFRGTCCPHFFLLAYPLPWVS